MRNLFTLDWLCHVTFDVISLVQIVGRSGEDPGFLLRTSAPLWNYHFNYHFYGHQWTTKLFLQNISCRKKPQVISKEAGGAHTPCTLPLDPPLKVVSPPISIQGRTVGSDINCLPYFPGEQIWISVPWKVRASSMSTSCSGLYPWMSRDTSNEVRVFSLQRWQNA